jgi:hypothetical protein
MTTRPYMFLHHSAQKMLWYISGSYDRYAQKYTMLITYRLPRNDVGHIHTIVKMTEEEYDKFVTRTFSAKAKAWQNLGSDIFE